MQSAIIGCDIAQDVSEKSITNISPKMQGDIDTLLHLSGLFGCGYLESDEKRAWLLLEDHFLSLYKRMMSLEKDAQIGYINTHFLKELHELRATFEILGTSQYQDNDDEYICYQSYDYSKAIDVGDDGDIDDDDNNDDNDLGEDIDVTFEELPIVTSVAVTDDCFTCQDHYDRDMSLIHSGDTEYDACDEYVEETEEDMSAITSCLDCKDGLHTGKMCLDHRVC